jgi:hypothetical protein
LCSGFQNMPHQIKVLFHFLVVRVAETGKFVLVGII